MCRVHRVRSRESKLFLHICTDRPLSATAGGWSERARRIPGPKPLPLWLECLPARRRWGRSWRGNNFASNAMCRFRFAKVNFYFCMTSRLGRLKGGDFSVWLKVVAVWIGFDIVRWSLSVVQMIPSSVRREVSPVSMRGFDVRPKCFSLRRRDLVVWQSFSALRMTPCSIRRKLSDVWMKVCSVWRNVSNVRMRAGDVWKNAWKAGIDEASARVGIGAAKSGSCMTAS